MSAKCVISTYEPGCMNDEGMQERSCAVIFENSCNFGALPVAAAGRRVSAIPGCARSYEVKIRIICELGRLPRQDNEPQSHTRSCEPGFECSSDEDADYYHNPDRFIFS